MKPQKLNRERPFGQVYGLAGVDYEQDGRYFNRIGDEVGVDNTPAPAEEPQPEEIDDGADIKPAEVVSSPAPEFKSGEDFENMHHMQLRAALKMYGEPYLDRPQAIAFLRGLKAA